MSSRRYTAPLLSGLVMPGLGQLLNRQTGKGALLICIMSLLFMALLFAASYELGRAVMALGEKAGQGVSKWVLLSRQLGEQGPGWLLAIGGAMFVTWLYAVIDAAKTGARLDRGEKGGE